MTEVQQGTIYVVREGDHIYDNPEPGNDFTITVTPSRGKSRCGNQVILSTSAWINSAIVILFVLVITALALSIYAILDRDQAVGGPCSCMVTAGSSSNATVSGGNAQVHELNDTIIQVKGLLEQVYISFEDRYNALNASIVSAIQSAQNVNNATNELDLYMGCYERVYECILDHTEAGTPPSSVSCETRPRPLEEANVTNTDIYCSIDNTAGETNPIVASLNIFGGQVKCVCSLIALSTPTAQVECKLHMRRCPDTILLI